MRIEIRKGEALKSGSEVIGNRTKAKVVKNKIAPPFRTAEFDIMYGEGISHNGELLDMAVELGIVKKGGAWFSYGETRLGQGRDNAKNYFNDHPEIAEEIEAKVRENAAKLYSRRKPAKAKNDESDAPEMPDAPELPEMPGLPDDLPPVPEGILIEDVPLPEEVNEGKKSTRRKKNLDITVD